MKFSGKAFLKAVLASAFLLVINSGIAQTIPVKSIAGKTDTLHLFLIGNSFSQNATRYLPQLAKEGGHHLIIGHAEIGGCTLKKHWELAELAVKNPEDPKGKPYKGKSLRMLLSQGTWDVVTMQQYSLHSGDVEIYQPYARKLYDFIRTLQPNAKVVLHQTWAYRSDSKDFSLIGENVNAKNADEMFRMLRAAYQTVAKELDVKIVPVGDAFWKVSSGKKWGYIPDLKFDFSNPANPNLPKQDNSLHQGYYRDNSQMLVFDSHHANEAGCYLGSLVWYTFLFGESPEKLKFVPKEVSPDFADYLKKTAKSVVRLEQ